MDGTQVLIRLGSDELEYVEKQRTIDGCSRSQFVRKCVRYAKANGYDLSIVPARVGASGKAQR